MNIKLYQPIAIHELGSRGNQEDFICPTMGQSTPDDRLFIVCDGMGGHEHGEVASSTFATSLAKFFEANVSPDLVLPDSKLADAIACAYAALDAEDDGSFKKMGTTLTLLYLHRGGVTAAHIGDSRIYHIRPGKGLLYVSRDHSLVYDLYQSGEISYDEMKTSNQKNVITRAVQPGEDNRVKPDIIHITDIEPGDYFYLCSDGMLEQMEDDELAQLLSADCSDEDKRQQLIDATADNKDNHSAYLIHVESVTREADDQLLGHNEEPTARCNALNIRPAKTVTVPVDEDVVIVNETHVPQRNESMMTDEPRQRNSKWLWMLAAIAAVAVAAVLAFGLGRNGESDAPSQPKVVEQPKSIQPIPPQSSNTNESVSKPAASTSPKDGQPTPEVKKPTEPAKPSAAADSPKTSSKPHVKPSDIIKPKPVAPPASTETDPDPDTHSI